MFIRYAVDLNTCCPDYTCSRKYELTSIRGLVDKIEHVCGTCCSCTISTSVASLRSYKCFLNHIKLWCTYSINIGDSIAMKFLEFWDKLCFYPDVDPNCWQLFGLSRVRVDKKIKTLVTITKTRVNITSNPRLGVLN